MQSVSSRIWTRVAVSISNDDNHYTTDTSLTHITYTYIHIYIQNTYWRNNKDERHSSYKNIPLTLFERFVCERELETEQNCNILTLTLMAISVVSFLFSRAAQPEA